MLGQNVGFLLIDEQHHVSERQIMKTLSSGQSWSGQFPFKRKSGQIFMALVTKSPLYEDGELVGVITVSSDAAVVIEISLGTAGMNQDRAEGQSRFQGINLKKLQWHAQPQVPSVPQIVSSISNLVLVFCSLNSFLLYLLFSLDQIHYSPISLY